MNELTLTLLRLGFLVALWLFVVAVVGILRGDLYGTRVTPRRANSGEQPRIRGAAPVNTPRQPIAPPQPQPEQRRFRGSGEPRRLIVTAGRLSGTSLPLREGGVLIGRAPECALVLDDDYASGRHARIYRDSEGWKVEDLGSTNGTFVGGQRLHGSTPVQVGTQLRIGKTVVELQR